MRGYSDFGREGPPAVARGPMQGGSDYGSPGSRGSGREIPHYGSGGSVGGGGGYGSQPSYTATPGTRGPPSSRQPGTPLSQGGSMGPPPAFHPPQDNSSYGAPPPSQHSYGYGYPPAPPPQDYWPAPQQAGREGPPSAADAFAAPPPSHGPPAAAGYGPPSQYYNGHPEMMDPYAQQHHHSAPVPPAQMHAHGPPPTHNGHPVTPPSHLYMPPMHPHHEYDHYPRGPPPPALTPRRRPAEGPVQIQFRREDSQGPSVYKSGKKKKSDALSLLAKVSTAIEDDPNKKKKAEEQHHHSYHHQDMNDQMATDQTSTPTRMGREPPTPPVAVTPHTAFHPPHPHYHYHPSHHAAHHPVHHHPHHMLHRPTSPAVISERNSFEEHSPYSYVQQTRMENKTILRKKFSWKHYPELEKFLIANRSDYLRHSAMNYTAEQKQYNNWLTERLLEVAARYHYVFDPDEFNFVAVRDRIRCYYKSYVQTARKRGVFVASVKSKLKKQNQAKNARNSSPPSSAPPSPPSKDKVNDAMEVGTDQEDAQTTSSKDDDDASKEEMQQDDQVVKEVEPAQE